MRISKYRWVEMSLDFGATSASFCLFRRQHYPGDMIESA